MEKVKQHEQDDHHEYCDKEKSQIVLHFDSLEEGLQLLQDYKKFSPSRDSILEHTMNFFQQEQEQYLNEQWDPLEFSKQQISQEVAKQSLFYDPIVHVLRACGHQLIFIYELTSSKIKQNCICCSPAQSWEAIFFYRKRLWHSLQLAFHADKYTNQRKIADHLKVNLELFVATMHFCQMEYENDFRKVEREDSIDESFLQLNLFMDGKTTYKQVYEKGCRHCLMVLSRIFQEQMHKWLEQMQPQGSNVAENDQIFKLLERSKQSCIFRSNKISKEVLEKELHRVMKIEAFKFKNISISIQNGAHRSAKKLRNNYQFLTVRK